MAKSRKSAKRTVRSLALGMALGLVIAASLGWFGSQQLHGPVFHGEIVGAEPEAETSQRRSAEDYRDPVARNLADLATELIVDPHNRRGAARRVHAISLQPKLFGDDISTYLVLRSAYWRLRREREVTGSLEVAQMLLDVADALEDNRGDKFTAQAE